MKDVAFPKTCSWVFVHNLILYTFDEEKDFDLKFFTYNFQKYRLDQKIQGVLRLAQRKSYSLTNSHKECFIHNFSVCKVPESWVVFESSPKDYT